MIAPVVTGSCRQTPCKNTMLATGRKSVTGFAWFFSEASWTMLQPAIEKTKKAKQFQQKLWGTCWKKFAANPLSSQIWLVSLSVWPVDGGKISAKSSNGGCEAQACLAWVWTMLRNVFQWKVGATIVSNVHVSISEPLGDGVSWFQNEYNLRMATLAAPRRIQHAAKKERKKNT